MQIDINNFIPFLTKVVLRNGKELSIGEIESIANNRYLIELIDDSGMELITLPYYDTGSLDVRLRGYLKNWDIIKQDDFIKISSMDDIGLGTQIINGFHQTMEVVICEPDPRHKGHYIVKFRDPKIALMIFDQSGKVVHPDTNKFSIIGYKK